MSGELLFGGVLALALLVYTSYAMLHPEKF
jgi:K+-transporting ATPase KdpF subunit